ncbi:MAG: sporulation protein YunB [Clostridia bacterium]|nr:sporulation protein YunB [Clostridia bacterium]
MRLGAKRILSTSKKSQKIAGLILSFGFFFAVGFISLCYVFCVLRPSIVSMAKSRAKEIGVLTLNRVVAEKLKKEDVDINKLIDYTYDESGKISSLSSNVAAATKLKSDLAIEATEAIGKIKKSEVGITLGTLSGIDILYGTGPLIPIEIRPYGYAQADIKTRFHEEGINQTAFEIVAEVSADVSVLMPTIKKSEKITTSVPIVSAVIVGDVPSSYTNVDRDGYEYEDDVLQLAE